jgi:hypothetical protein
MVAWQSRLAKDGARVLCARPNCPQLLGAIGEAGLIIHGMFTWYPDRAMFALSRTGLEHFRRGRKLSDDHHPQKVVARLPAQIQCPRCALIQVLADDLLARSSILA